MLRHHTLFYYQLWWIQHYIFFDSNAVIYQFLINVWLKFGATNNVASLKWSCVIFVKKPRCLNDYGCFSLKMYIRKRMSLIEEIEGSLLVISLNSMTLNATPGIRSVSNWWSLLTTVVKFVLTAVLIAVIKFNWDVMKTLLTMKLSLILIR